MLTSGQGPGERPYEAYGGGQSRDRWGKKLCTNLPLGDQRYLNVAMLTPSIHYARGGLKINAKAECVGPSCDGGVHYDACGRHMPVVEDGNNNMHAIRKAIAEAKACTDKPTLI